MTSVGSGSFSRRWLHYAHDAAIDCARYPHLLKLVLGIAKHSFAKQFSSESEEVETPTAWASGHSPSLKVTLAR